jgi:hypothetical protein
MKILITGTANQIASVIEEIALNQGHQIQKIGLSGLSEDFVNIQDKETWPKSINADIVIHSAWIMNPRTPKISTLNIEFSAHMLSRAAEAGAKFVFISSMSASNLAKSEYGKAKYSVELLCGRMNAEILRIALLQESSTNLNPGSAVRILHLIRRMPVEFQLSEILEIPICSREYLKKALLDVFSSGSNLRRSIVEEMIDFNKMLKKDNSLIPIKLNQKVISSFFQGGVSFSKTVTNLNDRWLSLLDSTIS